MVLAVIYFDVKNGAGFEAALKENSGSVTVAHGYRSHNLRRGVEQPDRYLLTVEWATIDDHKNWQKAHAPEFLGALGPFMTGGPDIKHFE